MALGVLAKLTRGMRRLVVDRSGAIAPMFAIMVVPMIVAAGVAVDYGRAVNSRNNLQDALDATGLAISHLPSTTPSATVQTDAQQWLTANLHDGSIGPVTLNVTTSLQQVTLTASASVSTTIGAMAGVSQVPISTTSTVQWGMNHIELAMVLDNTGSMADDSKLTSLVSAAKTLVSTLLASNTASDPNAVKISVVPFSNTVNVGTTYGPSAVGGGQTSAAAWLDPTAAAYAGTAYDLFTTNPYNGAAVNRFTLLQNMGLNWGGCVETRPQWVGGVDKSYDVTDTPPNSAYPGTQIVPYFAPDEPDNGSYNGGYVNDYIDDGQPAQTGTWAWTYMQGNTAKYYNKVATTQYCNTYDAYGDCSTKKSKNQTLSPSPNTGSTSLGTGYNMGPNFGCGIAAMQRLTTSSTELNTILNKMIASGDTNVPLGLFWGWMALTPNTPFADGVAYNTPNVTKIVIVLTDGANHSVTAYNNQDNSYYSGVGYQWQHLISTNAGSFSDPGLSMNDREAKICANMKAQGIVIYAVPVEVTDATAQSLLQGCASSSSNYINVTASSQLQAAFTNIAGSIGHLRISQ